MIPYLGCDAARELLHEFVDGELPTAEQVALESHLRWCRVCAARVEDMQIIGASLRVTSCAIRAADPDESLESLQSDVLTRISTEREQSFTALLRDMCTDLHFFWPAVGATIAVAACLCAAVAVFSVTGDERPDSLAGMIEVLANPGSDQNPMRLDGGMVAPPRTLNGAGLASIPGDEAVFALAAVVTREGRVANYEVLLSERASVRRHDTAVEDDDVSSVVNAVKQSRFSPAQAVDGVPVAVNMVWLLARTTVKAPVKASARALVEPTPLPARLAPPVAPPPDEANKPGTPSTSAATIPSTTA